MVEKLLSAVAVVTGIVANTFKSVPIAGKKLPQKDIHILFFIIVCGINI